MPNKEHYRYDFNESGMFQKAHVNAAASEIDTFRTYSRDVPILDLFGCGINPLFADWIEIALAAYFADRVSLRDSRKYHRERWKRRISLTLPVRQIVFWQRPSIKAQIVELLNFLTDDDWEFHFVSMPEKDRHYDSQRSLPLPPASTPRVALFSGGLDSFAGTLVSLQDDPEATFLLVSCVTNSRQLHNQQSQVGWLNHHLRRLGSLMHQPVTLGFNWGEERDFPQEPTQRTRGFLFLTLGSVAAINAGALKLELFENGIGAINLPYDGSQISAMNTRSVNPITLLMMEGIVTDILGKHFEITNPFLFSTKGEMCASIKNIDLADVIPLTFSCDGFPVHESGKPQCGVCTSCLLRRLSLAAADISEFDPGEGYGMDFFDGGSSPSFSQLQGLRAMDYQVQCIKDLLLQGRPWTAFSERFPQIQVVASELAHRKGLQRLELSSALLRLYQRHCDEWRTFPATKFLEVSKAKAA